MVPKAPPLHTTLASGLVALCFGFMLYGVVLCQVHRYFRAYRGDPLVFKIVVAGILLGETAHTILALYVGYFYFVENYGNSEIIGMWSLAISLEPVIMAITIALCQYIFLHRLYYMLPRWFKPWYILMSSSLSMCAIGCATTLTVLQIIDGSYESWFRNKWLVSTGFGITSGADVLIAAILVTTLHRSRTGIKRTDTLLDMLILYALSSGLVTCILSTTCLLVDVFEGNNMIIIPVSVVATKMYAIAVLIVLNSRRGLAERADGPLDPEWLGLSALRCTIPNAAEHISVNTHLPHRSVRVRIVGTNLSSVSQNSFSTAPQGELSTPFEETTKA